MITTSVAGRTWHFSHALGRMTGEHNVPTGGFGYPLDVAQAPDGHLFVISRGTGHEIEGYGGDLLQRVGKTTLDEKHIGDFARCGFTWPAGIAVASDGNVYVTDEFENTVTAFYPDGVKNFPELDPPGDYVAKWGVAGSAPGELKAPSGIKFDSDDRLHVSDSGNDRIQVFTKDGKYLSGFGEAGDAPGQFNRPWGLCIDPDGDVLVADWGNNRVQKFTAGGDYIMSFGSTVDDGGELDHPAAVAVDSDGDVYVSDWGNRRVQIYEPDGTPITALYGDVNKLSKAAEYSLGRNNGLYRGVFEKLHDGMTKVKNFERPVGMVIDSEDRLIVTDVCGRFQVYQKDNAWLDPVPQ